MIQAIFETPNFSFQAFGFNEADALRILHKAWDKHESEYDIVEMNKHQFGHSYLTEYECDVQYITVDIGMATRDNETIINEGK